jgi:hypothetical protein
MWQVLWYRIKKTVVFRSMQNPRTTFQQKRLPRSTEGVYSRILHPADVGYLKDVTKYVSDMSL